MLWRQVKICARPPRVAHEGSTAFPATVVIIDSMTEAQRIQEIYDRLRAAAKEQQWEPTSLSHFTDQPFKALIAGMLSAQTREEDTTTAANALFALADNPQDMARLSAAQIEQAIRPVRYHESKVKYVQDIARQVSANGGVVPRTVEELTAYKGVGWKVAVLTLATGYRIYQDITVDVHVGRIGKRLGLVDPSIRQPPKINEALKKILPRAMWPFWNALMVQFGREICQPTYPQCARCPLFDLCPRVEVVEIRPGAYKNAEYV